MNGSPFRTPAPPERLNEAPEYIPACSHCGLPTIGWDAERRESRCYWHEKTYRLKRIDESLKRLADLGEQILAFVRERIGVR